MSQPITEETSSCDTASYSEPNAARQIVLDVYYTSIYKDPLLINCETQIIKKQFSIFRDSYILTHKQSSKVKITSRKRQTIKLLQDGFEITAQVKFQRKENQKYTFTLQRNITPDTCHPYLKKILAETFSESINSLVFTAVKSEREFSKTQCIQDGSFIKLGKQIYRSRIFSRSKEMETVNLLDSLSGRKIFLESKESAMECKICLENKGQFQKDYIVSPCRCSGSCSAIHIECLKNWISQKIQVGKGDEMLRTYDMGRFACEICKEKYPETIQIENSIIDISPQMKINSDTLMLTKVFPVEEGKKYSHFISLEKGKTLSIGRHYTNELILDEMSISRNHATIYRDKSDKKFFIHDRNSRFGTFTNLKSPIQNLKEAVLLTSKLTLRLKLFQEENEKKSVSSDGDNEMTEENVEY